MNKTFNATDGTPISFASSLEQLKVEHILQHDRNAWCVVPQWPYLAIDRRHVRGRVGNLCRFAVFSSGQLWQNLRRQDLAPRLLGILVGGGTNAGLEPASQAFVQGKANAKAWSLLNWNEPLIVGSTPWCALGTHVIYVDADDQFQYEFGKLITVGGYSRPSSPHIDFTKLADLRDHYNTNYLNGPKEVAPDLDALSRMLEETFAENAKALAASDAFHMQASMHMSSIDYEAPVLTKYDRLTHDTSGQPKIEVSFALLHYEKAIIEFNAMKDLGEASLSDQALVHGVYCIIAAAACVEAIANKLVHLQTSAHSTRKDLSTPLMKIERAASDLVSRAGRSYTPLDTEMVDALDNLRRVRNGFMHAKEQENDIDPGTSASMVMTSVNEQSCRHYLRQVRRAATHVFSQIPELRPPIVIRENVNWMGDCEVP